MFNLTKEQWEEVKGINTATEITHQPKVWKEQFEHLKQQKEQITSFLNSIKAKHATVRVIFSGAGTSAFIGDILVPFLLNQQQDGMNFESIATTDIVSNPKQYLIKEIPTILVSFARSGNSPESIATANLCEEMLDHFYHIPITCNENGELARNTQKDQNSLLVLLPPATNDKGFAMTSSFSTMILSAYIIFNSDVSNQEKKIDKLIQSAEKLLQQVGDSVDNVLEEAFNRMVYIGSGGLAQLSHEAALKILELTAGKVAAIYESSLGFRHGPKSILNDKSMVVMFISADDYTKKYDIDMLKELAAEDVNVVAVMEGKDEEVEKAAKWVVNVNEAGDIEDDFYLSLLYIIFAQTLSLKKSLQLKITPDNPSPSGAVNRVVKGVTIYPTPSEYIHS